jgi:predicted DNA-binding transcriptional regulator YafY
LVRVLSELRRLERARYGLTFDELAAEAQVTTRTVRRDLVALEAAGVPILEAVGADGRKRWRVVDWRKEAA